MHDLITLGTVLSLALAAQVPAYAQMAVITPEQIGQIYCIGSLGNDMSPVGPLLTPVLATLIDSAFARSNEFELAHPGDKPPMGNGVPWRSWQDYADGCTVDAVEADDFVATVTIAYSFSQSPDANYTNDLVLLKDEGGVWHIDDVDLGDGSTLRSALSDAFAQ